MSVQYKSHPFVIALEALCPVVTPSFALRSARDGEKKPLKYPLVDYIIIGGQGKTYSKSKNQWRSNFLVQLDILFQEGAPLDWCKYKELQDAQDRQALFWKLEQMIEQFITLLVNPSAALKELKESDLIYGQFEFELDAYIATSYHNKKGQNNLTGISSQFVLSARSEEGGACCLNDGTTEQYERFQKLTKEGSVSYRLLENLINP